MRKRDDGSFYDNFRGRLMFPIHNEMGKVIGFGGRALADEDVPKYLNSPETPIYKKSKVVFNLHRAKEAIRKEDRAILVEGYMDVIGVVGGRVSRRGGQLRHRADRRPGARHQAAYRQDRGEFRSRRGRARKPPKASFPSCCEEGCRCASWNSTAGSIRTSTARSAARRRTGRASTAQGVFHWLADRARSQYDLRTTEGQVAVLKYLVPAVQRIPDKLERMQMAIEVAGYVGVDQANQGMVLDAFKKSVADRNERPCSNRRKSVRPDEKGLLNVLLSDLEGREALLERTGEHRESCSAWRCARGFFRRFWRFIPRACRSRFDAVNSRLEEADQRLVGRDGAVG